MCDVEKLLFLIETRPAIYNFKLREHSDKRIVDKLWLEIAEEMQATVTECKTKYTSLRNSYARFIREQPPSGSAPNKKKKTWYLAPAMSFLKCHMVVHRSTGSSVEPTVDMTDESMSSSIASPVHEVAECGESIDYTASSSGSKKRKLKAADRISEPTTEYFSSKHCRNDNEDPTITFFKSMLPDIRKLTDRNQRKVKQDFLFNLNNLLEEQEMETSIISTNNLSFVKNE